MTFAQTIPLAACILWSACSDPAAPPPLSDMPVDAGAVVPGAVHPRFELGQGSPMSLGEIPWPDDLYLDRQNRLSLADFPAAVTTDYGRALVQPNSPASNPLGDLDGFGVSTPVYFFLDGAIDAASLPQSADDSIDGSASVFLIDADTGSPDAFTRIRVETQWSASLRRIALRPALGHPLTPGRRYAALVTRRVKDVAGHSIEAAAGFLAVRAGPGTVSQDARLTQARSEYTPVIETLAKLGTAREEIAAMAVFRVQNTAPDLDAARRVVRAGKPLTASGLMQAPIDLDAALGKAGAPPPAVAHDHLLAMIHGTLPSPNFVSARISTHGSWERDETGQLRVKRTDDVPFTLFVPRGDASASVVIYQHQRGRERSDAVVLANALAARNIAVLAIDAPFEGLRAKSWVDVRDRFTGTNIRDQFGDVPGDFYGVDDADGGLVRFHPFYVRDAIRQGVVDLMTAIRFIDEGGLRQIADMPRLKNRQFSTLRLGFIGEDVGAQMGVLLAPLEPKLQVLALFAPSAFVGQAWWHAANDRDLFGQLAQRLGRDASNIDYDSDSPAFWSELAVFDTLVTRGEPLAYAAAFRRSSVNALLLSAQDDESVSNVTTEALAFALGASLVSGHARYVSDLGSEDAQPGDAVSGNFRVDSQRVTRVLQVYAPADHQLLLSATGSSAYVHPPDPPFEALAGTTTLANPTPAALQQVADYMRSYFDCVDAASRSSSTIQCAATVTAH